MMIDQPIEITPTTSEPHYISPATDEVWLSFDTEEEAELFERWISSDTVREQWEAYVSAARFMKTYLKDSKVESTI